MKLITVIIIAVFTITTSAIRVPPSWPKKQNLQTQRESSKFKTTTLRPSAGSEIGFQSRPHGAQMQKHNKINSGRKNQQNVRHRDLKKPQEKQEFKASATFDDWKPIFPPQKDSTFYSEFDHPFFQGDKKVKAEEKSPRYRNYRDEEKRVHHGKISSNHEVPLDVPTHPVYPGEGQWAKKNRKHRPFISKHKFTEPESDNEEERPKGYEIFEENTQLFEKQRQNYRENLDEFPRKYNLGTYLPEKEESDDEDDDESDKLEFVPTKLYTQVRRIENQEHSPRLVEDPRLREVIKDSKIQTVYTEEGYEDIAYDHAGHEKTAEQDEGFSEFDSEIEKEKHKLKQPEDSQSAGTQLIKNPHKMKKDKFVKTHEVKTVSLKDPDSGNKELEVLSEIKILETPNNGTESHKYVTIYPKVYRYDKSSEATVPELLPMESTVYRSRFRRRFKRFTNDFPKISVDTDFIDKINHNIPKKSEVEEKPKYPYYNDPTINHYSPLRYAEDLDNIPEKTTDELAFYHQADQKLECQDVETDVDPIPARVKNAEDTNQNEDVQDLPKTPRLKNLGDKIDCFKLKYFGEDPLDSPIFKEKEIGPVLPIFEFSKPELVEHEKRSYSVKVPVIKQKNSVKPEDLNILSDVIKQFHKVPAALKLQIVDPTPVTPETQTDISIITTPKYTINLKPKHIYHQIELLEYLPYYNKTTDVTTTTPTPNERLGKSMEEVITEIPTTEESLPESLALHHRRRPHRPIQRRPYYPIFDVNRYLPRNTFSALNRIIRTSTMLPKHDVPNEIKASEQLNVFADVINNIKNSSKDPHQLAAASSTVEKYRKIPVVETDLDNIEETNSFYLTTTTVAPRGTIKYSSYKNHEEFERDQVKYENLELLKIMKNNNRLTTTTERYSTDSRISSLSSAEEEDEVEEDTTGTVLGLMPPVPHRYKTIYNPKLPKPVTEDTKMNLFYVLGMKPPSPKQKVYLYSDFKVHPSGKFKYNYLRRGRRSAQRPGYSDVVRNRNKPIDVDDDTEVVVEEDDDYVPHRPKNYHYDEKTGRIVYEKTAETEAPEEEYVEVTEAPLPKPTRRNSVAAPTFKNFTGPSFVDFVKKLKSDPNYTAITDPPPTEKAEETTVTTTTAKPVSTDPPEFLGILAKVRSDSSYEAIADKTTSKITTTTEALVEEEEEEETQLENVQNSPGGQTSGQNYQIFDINEYLPKVKTYSPRTSIDYSKYKTIERTNTRHNLSSRYNSEEEDLENVKTTKMPVFMEDKKDDFQEINPIMSESKHEEVEPSTSSTTTASTTRRIRTRTKSRGTRRPTQRTTTPTTSAEEAVQVQHDKVKRVYPRRRQSRIKINRTTTELADSQIEESTVGKIIRRRHQKSEEAPSNKTEENKTNSPNHGEIAKVEKTADVQVFEKYDRSKKHGGNLKNESEESETKKSQEVKRLTDVVPKPSTFYSDPKLPKKVNQLLEVEVDEGEEKEEEEATENYDYEGAEDKVTTTKKPFFVKEPDKRMYYYAPV